jgi:DNA-binding transcriptional ArsR family regulator
MTQANDRLRRLVEDEVGSCCEADVTERLAGLEALVGDLPSDTASDLRTLKALGSETRYRIVRMLAAADGELCVCEFDPVLDVSQSAISHALSELTDAGLVTRRKEGKWRYYRATDRAERLVDALDATRRDGS